MHCFQAKKKNPNSQRASEGWAGLLGVGGRAPAGIQQVPAPLGSGGQMPGAAGLGVSEQPSACAGAGRRQASPEQNVGGQSEL